MIDSVMKGLSSLEAGFLGMHWSNPVMIEAGLFLLFLGIKKDVEPMLLLPIGFGAVLVNIPMAELMGKEGFLRTIYDMGIANKLFPLLIFIGIGATMDGRNFLTSQTLMIPAFGFVAICLDTICGVLMAKMMNVMTRGKINPLIGAGVISAYPMAARVVQREGLKYNPQNFLLMHAVGANTGGQTGSAMAAAIMLSVLKGMGHHCLTGFPRVHPANELAPNMNRDFSFGLNRLENNTSNAMFGQEAIEDLNQETIHYHSVISLW